MAGLRVFVSSTCFDLGAHRDQLRNFLTRMGYEPVMSEYADVLYDSRDHTHTNCVKEVPSSDIMILMIGSRFGGTVVADALKHIDFDKIMSSSTNVDILAEQEKLSITQLEVLKAVELDIPVFAFVNDKLYSEHHIYSANRGNPAVSQISFPSIEKPSTAKYIFGFIDFVTHRVANNAIVAYRSFGEIEDHLLKQWSLLFQQLLREQRDKGTEQRRADIVIEQIEGLKTVILQSIESPDAREVASGTIRYRRLVDILYGFTARIDVKKILKFEGSFDDLMLKVGIAGIEEASSNEIYSTYLILEDGTFFEVRFSPRVIGRLALEWVQFKTLSERTKEAIFSAVAEAQTSLPMVRYRVDQFSDVQASRRRDRPPHMQIVAKEQNPTPPRIFSDDVSGTETEKPPENPAGLASKVERRRRVKPPE